MGFCRPYGADSSVRPCSHGLRRGLIAIAPSGLLIRYTFGARPWSGLSGPPCPDSSGHFSGLAWVLEECPEESGHRGPEARSTDGA